jgi:hypothetical protein
MSRLTRWLTFLLAAVIAVLSGCQLVPQNPTRSVAERFVRVLESPAPSTLAQYLTPDAEVFLQGAQSSMSAPLFDQYVDRLKRGYQAFHIASPIFLTATGAGWLTDIRYLRNPVSDQALADPPERSLWMEIAIRDGLISRVWMHFTVESLVTIQQQPETYRATMAARGLPVPDGWIDGTPALVAQAELVDRQIDTEPKDPGPAAFVWSVPVGGLVLVVTSLVGRRKLQAKQGPTAHSEKDHGVLLGQLAQTHRGYLTAEAEGSNARVRRRVF